MDDRETSHTADFLALLDRLRAGEEDAARELIDHFGDLVRREIRFRLRDSRLSRVVGESDLFQSAVSRFILGLQLGKFDIHSPAELAGLLRKIAERRVCGVSRFWLAQCRDVRRHADLGSSPNTGIVSGDPTPSEALTEKELITEALARLPSETRHVLQWRQDGLSWAQIAGQLGAFASPEAVRKQYERAIERVAIELGLNDASAG